jgi:prepilin-type processing-associated H-X9-DG protein
MRHILRSCFALLVVCSFVRGQALVSRVPADAVAYLAWGGADSPANGYGGSRLQVVVESSNISALGEEFLPQLLAKVSAKNGDNGDGARFVQTVLSILWRHPSAIYFSGMTTGSDGAPLPKLGILCQSGEDTETLNTFLTAATQNSPPQKMARVIQSGDVIAFTTGYAEDEMPLANDPQQVGEVANRAKAIETDPDFDRMRKQVSPLPLIFGYLDTQKLLAQVDQLVQSGDNERAKEEWPRVRDVSGLSGLKHIAFSAGFEGRGWSTQAFIDAPAPREGVLSVIEPHPIDPELLAKIPVTAGFARIFQLNPGDILTQVRTMMAAARPDGGTLFDRAVGIVHLLIGRNPRTDIIDPLGSQWAIYNDSRLGDNPMLNTILINKPKDFERADTGWTWLWFALKNVGNPYLKSKHLPIKLKQKTVGDLEIHIVETPIADPCWTMFKGYLYIGLSPKVLDNAINEGGTGFSANGTFTALAKQLAGDEPATGFGFADLPATVAGAYPQVQTALEKLNELAAVYDLQLPSNLLPPLEKLSEQLTPSAQVSWADDTGIHFKSISPFPGASLFSPAPVLGASGLSEAVLSSTVLVPAIARSKKMAENEKSADNMRQIGRALLLHAAKNNGKCPPDVATMVSEGMLDAQCTKTPSGGAYVYTGVGVDITLVSDPSKKIVLRDPDAAAVDGKVNALFADGHVEMMPVGDVSE